MTLSLVALFVTPPSQGQAGSNLLLQFLPLALIFVIFYFLLIRPARAKQKAMQTMLDALKPGDRVVTTAGMHGTVVALQDDIVQIRIAENVKVDFSKSAVVSVVGKRE
ncbi:MAG TPA: preprotein translocase subunit YajC [Candidatus Polarisedimenticolia bacterium]|nr:preprotein translocase subunit YajC [Candidatus Polarisedimenticolia bacterium]